MRNTQSYKLSQAEKLYNFMREGILMQYDAKTNIHLKQ